MKSKMMPRITYYVHDSVDTPFRQFLVEEGQDDNIIELTPANAQAIAALPELLRIVQALKDWYEESGYNGNGPQAGALLFDDDETFGSHIRAALRKARTSN